MPFAKGSKYRPRVALNDRAKRTYKGVVYHSIRERDHAAQLDMQKGAKDPALRVVRWDRQVCVPLDVSGKHITNVFVDFCVLYGDGRIQYEEVKGYRTETWRLKEKLFRALHPDKALKIIR